MFFSVRDIKSAAIQECAVNLCDNQVLVKYNGSDKTYIYNNVSTEDIIDFLCDSGASVGKFVNYCAKLFNDSPVTVIAWQ